MKWVCSIDVDRLLTEFEVEGHPVPHSFDMRWVPNPGGGPDKTGRRGRHVPNPNPRLTAWEAKVRDAARMAMGYRRPFDKPVLLELVFTVRPRGGEPDGSPMTTPVTADGRKQDRTMPDIDNLGKAVQDGLASVVLANDVLVSKLHTEGFFGRSPGVKVRVYALKLETSATAD
jgi:Holliday junction resolvase RusA-like endonuclease